MVESLMNWERCTRKQLCFNLGCYPHICWE